MRLSEGNESSDEMRDSEYQTRKCGQITFCLAPHYHLLYECCAPEESGIPTVRFERAEKWKNETVYVPRTNVRLTFAYHANISKKNEPKCKHK